MELPLGRAWSCALRASARSCVVVILLGCAASGYVIQLADLVQLPGFDAKALAQGGVAIFGFESAVPSGEPTFDDRLDYPLYLALRRFHPRLRLVGAKTTRSALRGAGVHDSIGYLLASGRTAELPYDTMRRTVPSRFVLSAQLVSDEIDTDHSSSRSRDTYCTTRGIRIRYRILDLAREQVAYQAVVRRNDEDCNTNTRSNATRNARGKEIVGALLVDLLFQTMSDAISGTYPAPSALPTLAAEAANDLASSLPGALPRETVEERERASKPAQARNEGWRKASVR
jgi:hypothetical protein